MLTRYTERQKGKIETNFSLLLIQTMSWNISQYEGHRLPSNKILTIWIFVSICLSIDVQKHDYASYLQWKIWRNSVRRLLIYQRYNLLNVIYLFTILTSDDYFLFHLPLTHHSKFFFKQGHCDVCQICIPSWLWFSQGRFWSFNFLRHICIRMKKSKSFLLWGTVLKM